MDWLRQITNEEWDALLFAGKIVLFMAGVAWFAFGRFQKQLTVLFSYFTDAPGHKAMVPELQRKVARLESAVAALAASSNNTVVVRSILNPIESDK